MPVGQRELIRDLVVASPIVRSQDLLEAGANRNGIAAAVGRGDLVRVAQGIFCSPSAESDPMLGDAVACLATGGIICHRTAGARHGLTDDLPNEIEVLVPPTQCRTPLRQPVRIVRSQNPESFTLGIGSRTVLGVEVRMTDRARTVVDLVRGPVRQHAVAAVHAFLAEGGTGEELARMAGPFGAGERLTPIVEGVLQALSRAHAP